ncbi:peptide chain release factor N(5)-glutamine methyltransferase [Acidisphaera rubrifaciens]|uniref:Release factor glutamine methyltransferase n=1 Tax=Acidisphaera rubrifaciens HS-AP3 TaxID=1231350 RepID=A0A0D6P5G6_9PROT|nr:peptide chain release factor N(5)-glutamine methyltransferase [Acidisphaera rubrifaciens]GAN77015.1 protein methyltransferase HemK [Acidisphaera rubrifaciens HS-AP3]
MGGAVTRAAALDWGAARLAEAGIDTPRLEARLLLAHALGVDAATLLADRAAPLAASDYHRLIERRAARVPLAYLLGTREFWSLPFAVSPATLIPRPDSETVVEAALAAAPAPPSGRGLRVLDLGTGTGCLLLSLLSEWPDAWGLGVDVVPSACALAAGNAAALGLAGRAAFLCADWDAALRGRFDVIVANPPYIPRDTIAALMPEVARHEPASALNGGADGLDPYRRLLPTLSALLAPGGVAVFEHGADQAAALADLAARWGFDADPRRDLAGLARAVVLRPAGTPGEEGGGTGGGTQV